DRLLDRPCRRLARQRPGDGLPCSLQRPDIDQSAAHRPDGYQGPGGDAAMAQPIKRGDNDGLVSERARLRMVETLRAQGVRSPAVLRAMSTVPRHIFVEHGLASRAYEDVALPIGHGQT